MITIKEAAQKAVSFGIAMEKDGSTIAIDIGDENGFYAFIPDEKEIYNMICVSKKDGEISWPGVGYLCTNYDLSKEVKVFI